MHITTSAIHALFVVLLSENLEKLMTALAKDPKSSFDDYCKNFQVPLWDFQGVEVSEKCYETQLFAMFL